MTYHRRAKARKAPKLPGDRSQPSNWPWIVTAVLVVATLLWLFATRAHAQTPPNVTIQPYTDATIQNGSGTITSGTGGAFQSVFAAPDRTTNKNQKRQGCWIQNNAATNAMFVFFGPIASATTGASYKLAAGQAISCSPTPAVVIEEQISVSGTAADAFFAIQQ